MSEKAIFYYDETFHDRRLTVKNGILNAYSENSYDGFIFGVLGKEENKMSNFLSEFEQLEKRTKETVGLTSELKSTVFNSKLFRYGLSSLRKDAKNFYFSFFDLLIKHDILFQIGCVSKTEIIIHRLLSKVVIPFRIPYKSFVYSFTKLLEHHRLDYSFTNLLDEEECDIEQFIKKTINLLTVLLKNIHGIEREAVEEIVVQKIIQILENTIVISDVKINGKWNYDIVAEAVRNRIAEESFKIRVLLDNEQYTYDAFRKANINCQQGDSNSYAGIRATDLFVGFAGRVIRSLKEDIKESPLNDVDQIKRELYTEKRLVSKKWFEINKETFELYKRIGNYFSKATYWSSFQLCYGDDLIMFFSLFNYINTYNDYDSFCKNIDYHNEYFNTYVCEQIKDLYLEEAEF